MDKIVVNMKNNRKYGIVYDFIWFVLVVIGIIGILIFLEFMINELFDNMQLWINLVNYVLVIVSLIGSVVYFTRQQMRKRELERKRIQLETNINKEEFTIDTFFQSRICIYHLVGYYVEADRTYRFEGEIKDIQHDVVAVFRKIKNEGIFPKLTVWTDPTSYDNYEIMGYEFLDQLLKLNKDIVDEIRYGL